MGELRNHEWPMTENADVSNPGGSEGVGWTVAALFLVVVCLGSGLLFFVQPLAAKLALPLLGGAASVWTTAMLFFQAVLLAGYGYAHLLATRVPPALQVPVHLVVLGFGLAALPISVPAGWTAGPGGHPALQTLGFLALAVGLPFFALAANAPLIQTWYSRTGAPAARDPYHLYGASNAGSLLALLGFPLVAEPLFGAAKIAAGWAAAYVVLILGVAACGWASLRGVPAAAPGSLSAADEAVPPVRLGEAAVWAALGFVPSSLMLGVTAFVTTDLGSFPFLWVIPLALFLLSFVIGFSRWYRPRDRISRLVTLAVLLLMALPALFGNGMLPRFIGYAVVTGGFFVVALHCHSRLYALRPATRHLTRFYFTMSLGGVVGGLFNSVIAPAIFDTHAEFPIALVVAALVVAPPGRADLLRSGLAGAAVGVVAALLWYGAARTGLARDLAVNGARLGAVLCLWTLAVALIRPKVAGLALGTAAALLAQFQRDDAVLRARSFFGAYTIKEDADRGLRTLIHGTTLHGAVRIGDLAAERPVPVSYYHADGPMGRSIALLAPPGGAIGVIGLGVGSLACHAGPEQDWTFFEIDPLIDRIARDPALFPYMTACGGRMPTLLGDARTVLASHTGRPFDLLIVDAYSSDAVPVHLATVEAVTLYLARLAPRGAIVLHVSNRYYDLDRVLLGAMPRLSLAGALKSHVPSPEAGAGVVGSRVVALASSAEILEPLIESDGWSPLTGDNGVSWTDDSASPLAVLRGR